MKHSKYETMNRLIADMKLPDYRYKQIIKTIFSQRISTFESMSTLPLELKKALIDKFGPFVCSTVQVAYQSSGQADKILLALPDGNRVETVNLHYKNGWESFCISSQCGCSFGCQFCATGTIGLKRNMTADEITDQLLYFYLNGHNLNSISFMGMGEPLVNPYLFDALNTLNDSSLFGLSQRRITISTIGIIPGIKRLTHEFPQINLAFSMHSPFEKQRSELMPVNRSFPLHEVMEALDNHIRHTGRRLFLAYIMLNGVNDSVNHAKALINLLKNRGSWAHLYHVDLIPYNSTDKTPRKFASSDKGNIKKFSDILHAEGISVATRTQFGTDISAACGQLYGDEPAQIVHVKDFQKKNLF